MSQVLLAPLVYLVVTVCEPGKACDSDKRGPIPMDQCQAMRAAVLNGTDGREPLRYNPSVTIECKEGPENGR